MEKAFYFNNYGKYNITRIQRFMNAQDESAAIYMGGWDKFKDVFRNHDEKKITHLKKLWSKLYENNESNLTLVARFKELAKIAVDYTFSIKKEQSFIAAAPVNVHFQINGETILSLSCDKAQFYKLKLNELNFNASDVHTIFIDANNNNESESEVIEDTQGNYQLRLDGEGNILKIKHWSESIEYNVHLTDKKYLDPTLFRYEAALNGKRKISRYFIIKRVNPNSKQYNVVEKKPTRTDLGCKPSKYKFKEQGNMCLTYSHDQERLENLTTVRKHNNNSIVNKIISEHYQSVIDYFTKCEEQLRKNNLEESKYIILPVLKNSNKDLGLDQQPIIIKEAMPFIPGTKPVLLLNKIERSQKLFLKMFNLTIIGQKNGLFFIDNAFKNWIHHPTDELYRIDLTFEALCQLAPKNLCGANDGVLGGHNDNSALLIKQRISKICNSLDYQYIPVEKLKILKRIQALVELTLDFMDFNNFIQLPKNLDSSMSTLSERISKILTNVLPKKIPPFDRSEFIKLVATWKFPDNNYHITIREFMTKYYDQNTCLPKIMAGFTDL